MNLLTGSMTPEQFQQYQQEQQQAFFRWQQSQILNRDLDNLQQNPPSFHSESSQTLTQPQQVDSPKKGGRKKKMARKGKNVEDEPQEPVAAGRWLPVEEELLATCYVAVSEDNNVGSQEDLFGHDARPRPPANNGPPRKANRRNGEHRWKLRSGPIRGKLMEQELRLIGSRRKGFEAQAEKDRTLMRLEELRFLATSTKDLDEDDAYWIKKQKKLIKKK
ncbi:hypothetical protein Tco_0245567 [Tanacetum coccineum]